MARKSNEEFNPIVGIVIAIIFGIYLLWVFVLKPFFAWLGTLVPLFVKIIEAVLVIIVAALIGYLIYRFYGYIQYRRDLPRIRAEEERIRKENEAEERRIKLENEKYEVIGIQRRDEILQEGIFPERFEDLSLRGLTPIQIRDNIDLGKLGEGSYIQLKQQLTEIKKYREIGSQRRIELNSLGITDFEDDNEELGELSDHNYNRFKLEKKRELDERRNELERIKREEDQKLKEKQIEASIVLTRVLNCKSEELDGLNEEQKAYLSKKWEKEISQLFEAGNTSEQIINYLCGKEGARIKRSRDTEEKPKPRSKNKFQTVIETIRNYNTTRIIRDERELESVIYEHLKTIFQQPQFNVEYQKKFSKGRVDIVIDEDIAIELKIAESKNNLNQLFHQVEWYKDEYQHLILVILDLDRVPDIDDFVHKFEERGATVIILTEENVRFRRRSK